LIEANKRDFISVLTKANCFNNIVG